MPSADESYENPTQPLPRYRPEAWTGEPPPAEPVRFRATVFPANSSPGTEGSTGGEIPTIVEPAETAGRSGRPSQRQSGADPNHIPTPRPLPIPPAQSRSEPRRAKAPAGLWAVAILALLVSMASLALNGILVYRAAAVRQKAVAGLDTAISGLENLGSKGFHYNYRFKRTIPFSGEIPFKQEMTFPFEGDIPINTTVKVPVDAGLLGTFEIEVPINTNVHINTSVPLRIDETFPVNTEIPIDMTIPIDVKPGDPAIQELVSPIREWLIELRDSF